MEDNCPSRSHQAAPDESNHYNFSGPPILFVPGVMGSRIERPGNDNSRSGMIWDPDDTIVMLTVAAMHTVTRAELFSVLQTRTAFPCRKWSEVAKKAGVTEEQRQRGWAGLSWNFYGRGLQDLQTHADVWEGKVYAFGYDWRKSNIDSGELLAQKIAAIRQENDNKKVLVVTHSMGGLVTRAACRVHGAEANVLGVVHTLQPAFGTPLSYRLSKMGASSGTPWLWDGGGMEWVADHVLATIQGRTPVHYAIVSHGLRGPFELLPNQLMHRCTGQETSQPPGEHGQAPNSWLDLQSDDSELNSYLASARHIYAYYDEPTGRVGLTNFEYWDSEENRYILDSGTVGGAVVGGAAVGSLLPGVGTAAGATVGAVYGLVGATRRIWGPTVANGIRAGIASARAYHLRQVQDYAHPNTCNVAGDGRESDTGFSISIETGFVSDSIDYERVVSPYGDGTVSLTSATALRLANGASTPSNRRQFIINGVSHAGAFGDSQEFRAMVWRVCKQALALAPRS